MHQVISNLQCYWLFHQINKRALILIVTFGCSAYRAALSLLVAEIFLVPVFQNIEGNRNIIRKTDQKADFIDMKKAVISALVVTCLVHAVTWVSAKKVRKTCSSSNELSLNIRITPTFEKITQLMSFLKYITGLWIYQVQKCKRLWQRRVLCVDQEGKSYSESLQEDAVVQGEMLS